MLTQEITDKDINLIGGQFYRKVFSEKERSLDPSMAEALKEQFMMGWLAGFRMAENMAVHSFMDIMGQTKKQ